MSAATLRITEIFYSLQGETTTSGLPTAFIRLTGCPLRCHYCDTEYAFFGGEKHLLSEVLEQVKGYQPRFVTVTGGEPLAQPNCLPLLEQLCDAGYRVSLETSGALPIGDVDNRVVVILDLKTPASGESGRNLWDNLPHLKNGDEIKFVICDRADYEWVRFKLDQYSLNDGRFELLFSPSQGQLEPAQLAQWIMEDNLPVRLQMQLHKQLWGDEPGT
ncbi:MAG: 7-carboxy-7-deazaguanine synthase QueE [Gammaproteobacteria bacterium]|nr:7-carboxy-7-deazaguanine synthase QueE [Gammaproteobacteria bacterium]MBQ0840710.1 7-carboxy-7-deazaguanine synthase QueE [Gammaproteobacteria bacterium]